ncbi:hypothetical protein Nepgr_017713 [Nepenthes gracilis]|uniref:Uncharacterized protein n=1 Tax=Nepenthes gracilis TaxID=150966 RepID=A0AAD3SSU2_NEPGR|nr:hypothetical protein Nepgr_017713 [Nepenthes gracilis]
MSSSLSSNPLFSAIVAFYTLILLYFPRIFLKLVFSPLLISTGILLLSLLRLGATQKKRNQRNPGESNRAQSDSESRSGLDQNRCRSFVEWSVSAPLEVIYEAYEGEEGENDGGCDGAEGTRFSPIMERYPSLSRYYPESDSDCSSEDGEFPRIEEWDSPESVRFRWEEEEEEEREGLIEIALDGKTEEDILAEEENLIEINILR